MNMQTPTARATANATLIATPTRQSQLGKLIQKWNDARTALDKADAVFNAAYDAAEAAMPAPDVTITKADPLFAEAKDYDFRIRGAAWSGFIETTLTLFEPSQIIERDTPDGHAFVWLTDRQPLTPERLQIRAQLEARLETARAYERLWAQTKLAHGVDTKHDDVIARYSAAMLRLEHKIADHHCHDLGELREKISFILQCVDREGVEYFAETEMFEATLRDTLTKLVA